MDIRSLSLGDFAALPDFLINNVLLFLADEADLVSLGSVSRVMRVLCSEEAIWSHFCLTGHTGQLSFMVSHCVSKV